MVWTDTEAFSVVDLCRSVSTDVMMGTPRLLLNEELDPLPVAVGLREVAVSKQDRNTHHFIKSFYDSLEWEVLQLDEAFHRASGRILAVDVRPGTTRRGPHELFVGVDDALSSFEP